MCGLKLCHCLDVLDGERVTPFVGVWIETGSAARSGAWLRVTPFVGVWIETYNLPFPLPSAASHPSWVCGLKLYLFAKDGGGLRHTLRGCVD